MHMSINTHGANEYSCLLEEKIKSTLPNARLISTILPGLEGVPLLLIDPDSMTGPLSHEEAQAVVAEPAYWCFCWASGQVLARYIMANPKIVKGKSLIDVGSGSGVVAVAAALAGASRVVAVDIDPVAQLAITANAALNNVDIEVINTLPDSESYDLLSAADILYDRDNLPLLERFLALADSVWLTDSRIKDLSVPGYRLISQLEAITWPDLDEYKEFNQVRLYQGCSG